jgi:hypothetical protein
METTNHTIHCKATYNNITRRFKFVGTEFTSLRATINKLYSLNNEFVLKYIDDERDEIIMECQQDFITACQVTPLVLRLVMIATPGSVPLIPAPSPVHEVEVPLCDYTCPQSVSFTPGPAMEVPLSDPLYLPATCKVELPEHRKLRLERKLKFVNQALLYFGSDDSKLTPRQIEQKQRLLKKQERTTACLNGNCPRRRKSWCPENALYVKQQRCLLKAEMCSLKTRKRELRILLKENKDDKKLIEELTQLKERSKLIKAQRRSIQFDKVQ